MPKLNERRADAFRGRLTVPMTEELLAKLDRKAEEVGRKRAQVAREFIERGLASG